MARRGETLELAVLGLLHESPQHGYELRKRLNVMLGWGRVLSYGSLYPTLKKMLRAGSIAESETRYDAAVAVGRRQRIVYEITPAGEEHFAQLLSEVGPSAWEDDNFDIRFALFSRTDMESRLRILEGRRSRLQERLERVQAQLQRTQREMDQYATELQRHGVESVEREVRWLSDLINAEHDQQSQHEQHPQQPGQGPEPPEADAPAGPPPGSPPPRPVPRSLRSREAPSPPASTVQPPASTAQPPASNRGGERRWVRYE